MVLDALAPFVQFLGIVGIDDRFEVLARGAIAAFEPFGQRPEVVGIDGQSGEGGA